MAAAGFSAATGIHIGVESPFQPALKAHPAFGVSEPEQLRGNPRAAGVAVINDDSLPGVSRFYAADPWGTGSNSYM